MATGKIAATCSSTAAPSVTATPIQHMSGLEGLEELGITPDEARRIQAHMATGGKKQQAAKFVINKTDENEEFPSESIEREATLYFKNCVGCEYVVDSECTKIMIDNCHDCKFTINARIMTEMVEMWNCENSTATIDTPVKTFQLDLSTNINLNYKRQELLGSLVWAGVYDLHLCAGSEPYCSKMHTGVRQIEEKGEVENYNTDADQFIIRFLRKKLCEELIVRLPNGFPTTEREAQAFDERKARDDEKYERFVLKVIKQDEAERGTKKEKEKVARNAACPCKSGKKYKKCCLNKEATAEASTTEEASSEGAEKTAAE